MTQIIKFTEKIDRNALFYITRNFDSTYKNEAKMSQRDLNNIKFSLMAYLKKTESDGTIDIIYEQKTYNKKDTLGRLYPVHPTTLALSNMPRQIRNVISNKYVKDIDIENAHPSILMQYCNHNDVSCPILTEYVNNREEWLESIYPNDREKSKKTMLKLMYCGELSSDVKFQKAASFKDELSRIVMTIGSIDSSSRFKENNKYSKLANNKKYKHYYDNVCGALLSYLLQDIENKILLECIDYCKLNNIHINTLIYDGFTVNIDDDINLQELSNYVNEQIGYKLKFVFKPMLSPIVIPDNTLDLSNKIEYDVVKQNFEEHVGKILNPVLFVDSGIILSREQLKNKYENLIYHKLKKEQLMPHSFVSDWLQDPQMKTYEKFGLYPPPLECPNNVLNLYRKYEWESYAGDADLNVNWFIEHTKLMVNYEESAFEFVVKWIAHIIQTPGVKTGTLLSFVGQEGIGKSMFVKILARLIGQEKFMETNNPENNIFGRFANWSDKTICVLNDYNPAETRGCQREMFKQFITEASFTREKKGIDMFETQNFTNFITTTNSYNPVHKTEESRRYLVIEASPKKKGDYEYFKNLDDSITSDTKIYGLYQYLKNIDLSDFNIRTPPKTEIGNLISQENANPFEMFIDEYKCKINKLIHFRREDIKGFTKCKKEDTDSVSVISQRELFSCFISWCVRNNMDSKKFNSKKLQTEMYRKRDIYKMSYKPNKSNSQLSMWVVNDLTYWNKYDTTDETNESDGETEDI